MERSTTDGVHIWLAQALATPWSSSVLAPELTDDILAHVMHAWSAYDTNTKTGLLFAFLCVKKGQMTPMRERVLQQPRLERTCEIRGKATKKTTPTLLLVYNAFKAAGFDNKTPLDRPA
ncbi:hypothetical protein BC936DRAFT_137703 [Jimgerdemannia flammicorona]|uniref:Uncharacterized protein n=1 Tax=Jimgerdemannia flammicorona TaxID=994334 RepID=A0A433CWU7_9FUNG|nr:hypothetical protein BC936DRAFT_137703 [Jimgerdemannia flammicorona]